jgi:hypothetical protein
MNIYYVYQYLRKDGTPYYIGKGSGRRAYAGCRTIPKPKDKNLIQIIAHKLSELESFLLETKLIKHYGRIDLGTGILRNLTNGGEGASNVANKVAWNKGKKQSLEHNQKISNSLKGKSKSDESVRKMKEKLKGRVGTMLGKSHSLETKDKISKSLTGKLKGPDSEETKKKKSMASKGKPKNPVSVEKQRQSLLKYYSSK